MEKNSRLILLVIISVYVFAGKLFAIGSGGFENASFSARSLAESNAVIAQADEPAAISYNPAGIAFLPGFQAQYNSAFISAFTHYSDEDTGQGSTRSSGTINFIPTAYVTINPGKYLNNRLAFGIGSDSPFGISNKYDSNHGTVHYTGYKNWLKMFTIKPVMSLKIADWLSVGGGPIYYRIYDFGTVLAYPNKVLQTPFGGPIPAAPFLPEFADGQLRLDLSGNSWGWHLGVLLKPYKKHHFGFYFRSPTQVKLKGRIKVENAVNVKTVFLPFPPFFALESDNNRSFETGGHTKLNLPLNITVGYVFRPNDKAAVETDFGFTRWSTFNRLYVNADPVNPADDAILSALGRVDADYRNSFAIHLGGNYKATNKFTLRGGTHFFWTPVPKTHFRPAIPDANSLAFSLGLSYNFLPAVLLDIVYYNRFNLRRHINNDISEILGTTVDGQYFSYAQEFIISLTYKWEDFLSRK